MTDTFRIIITVGILLIVLAIALVLLPRILREKEQPQRVTEMDMVLSSFQTMGNELKALKEQLVVKERLAALGEISAGIAHEFRNPMSVISGYAKLLAKGFPEGDERRELVDGILREINGMNAVMTELLGFSRSEPIQKISIPLRAFLDELVSSFTEKNRISIDLSGNVSCDGDATLLRQAVRNLIKNALEAGAGEVRVSAGSGDVSGRRSIWITVQDNGPGLDEADLGKIFAPFYTTKADGTGIGLALVQKIVLAHGGFIAVESGKGSGALFRIELPCEGS